MNGNKNLWILLDSMLKAGESHPSFEAVVKENLLNPQRSTISDPKFYSE